MMSTLWHHHHHRSAVSYRTVDGVWQSAVTNFLNAISIFFSTAEFEIPSEDEIIKTTLEADNYEEQLTMVGVSVCVREKHLLFYQLIAN